MPNRAPRAFADLVSVGKEPAYALKRGMGTTLNPLELFIWRSGEPHRRNRAELRRRQANDPAGGGWTPASAAEYPPPLDWLRSGQDARFAALTRRRGAVHTPDSTRFPPGHLRTAHPPRILAGPRPSAANSPSGLQQRPSGGRMRPSQPPLRLTPLRPVCTAALEREYSQRRYTLPYKPNCRQVAARARKIPDR